MLLGIDNLGFHHTARTARHGSHAADNWPSIRRCAETAASSNNIRANTTWHARLQITIRKRSFPDCCGNHTPGATHRCWSTSAITLEIGSQKLRHDTFWWGQAHVPHPVLPSCNLSHFTPGAGGPFLGPCLDPQMGQQIVSTHCWGTSIAAPKEASKTAPVSGASKQHLQNDKHEPKIVQSDVQSMQRLKKRRNHA